jgi:hypothetical protein
VLVVGKLLDIWQPRAVTLAQTQEQDRPEEPARQPRMSWSSELAAARPDAPEGQRIMVKLVVTNMATSEQSYLVLDSNESYLIEVSVA